MESAADTEFRVSNEVTSESAANRFFMLSVESIFYLPMVKCLRSSLTEKQYSCQKFLISAMRFFK